MKYPLLPAASLLCSAFLLVCSHACSRQGAAPQRAANPAQLRPDAARRDFAAPDTAQRVKEEGDLDEPELASRGLNMGQDNSNASNAPAVIVNDVQLDPRQVRLLQQMYGALPPGRYWYDPMSGIWGIEGGPGIVQIQPGLPIGGSLRSDASHGTTGVFVNGRQLHLYEVLALQRCTQVFPGRYWMNAAGIGGYEGGPASFNLTQLCAGSRAAGPSAAARGGNHWQTETYGNGAAWSGNSRTGGGVTTDGHGGAAVFLPGGGMVMTP